jgi:predicted HicB family RNase H-like nuclease
MNKRETKSERMMLLVTPSLKACIDEIAYSNRISRNELVNIVLNDFANHSLEATEKVSLRNLPLYE